MRLLLCLATALAVSATAYLCAWLSYRNTPYPQSGPFFTKRDLDQLREDIEAHKERTGEWPARLTELNVVKKKRVRVDEGGQPVDWWGRPTEYHIEEDGYLLCSRGRDGTP